MNQQSQTQSPRDSIDPSLLAINWSLLQSIEPESYAYLNKKFAELTKTILQQQEQIALLSSDPGQSNSSETIGHYQAELERLEKELSALRSQKQRPSLSEQFSALRKSIAPTENELKNQMEKLTENFWLILQLFAEDFKNASELKKELRQFQKENFVLRSKNLELENKIQKYELQIERFSDSLKEKDAELSEFMRLASNKESENLFVLASLQQSEEEINSKEFLIENLKSELLEIKQISQQKLDSSESQIDFLVQQKIDISEKEKLSLEERLHFFQGSFKSLSAKFEELSRQKSETFEEMLAFHNRKRQELEELSSTIMKFAEKEKTSSGKLIELEREKQRIESELELSHKNIEFIKGSLLKIKDKAFQISQGDLKTAIEQILGKNAYEEESRKSSIQGAQQLTEIITFINSNSPDSRNQKDIPGQKIQNLTLTNAPDFSKKIKQASFVVEENGSELLSQIDQPPIETPVPIISEKNLNDFAQSEIQEPSENQSEQRNARPVRKSILDGYVRFRGNLAAKNEEALNYSALKQDEQAKSKRAIESQAENFSLGKSNLLNQAEQTEDEPALKYLKEIEKKNDEIFELRRVAASNLNSSVLISKLKSETETFEAKIRALEKQLENSKLTSAEEKGTRDQQIQAQKEEIDLLKKEASENSARKEQVIGELGKSVKALSSKIQHYEQQANL